MSLSMARCVVFSLLLPLLVGGSVLARPEPQLSARQTILEANRHLIADGWRPAPEKKPTPQERRWASVALESLSACPGTGVGFCRFDYRRDMQRLSVVTVPSEPGRPSVGRVERLNLGPHPHQRTRWNTDTLWQEQPLNP